MRDEPVHAVAAWYFLPAQDAHHSRLPAGHAPSSRRAQRSVSAALLRDLGRAPSRDDARRLLATGLPAWPGQWHGIFLAAGVRCFSSMLRRRTGGGLATALMAAMGPEPWRVALQWAGPALDPALSLDEDQALSLVECAGAELVLAHLEGPDGPFKRRVQLRFSDADVRFCSAQLPPVVSAACVDIATAALRLKTE